MHTHHVTHHITQMIINMGSEMTLVVLYLAQIAWKAVCIECM